MSAECVAIVSCIASIVSACAATGALFIANANFKKSMTAQVELYVLSTLKDELLENKGANGSKEVLITTVDYWCKLITNDCLDETLSADSYGTIETLIKNYRDDINKGNRKYIIEYAKRKGISLQVQ